MPPNAAPGIAAHVPFQSFLDSKPVSKEPTSLSAYESPEKTVTRHQHCMREESFFPAYSAQNAVAERTTPLSHKSPTPRSAAVREALTMTLYAVCAAGSEDSFHIRRGAVHPSPIGLFLYSH